MKPVRALCITGPDVPQLVAQMQESVNAAFSDLHFTRREMLVVPDISPLGAKQFHCIQIVEADDDEAVKAWDNKVANAIQAAKSPIMKPV